VNDSSRLQLNVAMLLALFFLLVLPAWWSPLQFEDWAHVAWGQTATLSRVISWLRREHTIGDLMSRLIVVVPWLHIIATPLVYLSLCAGVVAASLKLRPSLAGAFPAWTIFVSALVFFATPRCGQLLWHRQFAGYHLYGLAALVWFVALVRRLEPAAPAPSAWRKAGWLLLGFASGASTHYTATVLLGWTGWLLATRRRPAWLVWGVAGVLLGTAAVWLDKPPPTIFAVVNRGLDRNLGVLYGSLGHLGRAIALTLAVGLAQGVWRAASGRTSALAELDEPRDVGGFLIAAAAVALLALAAPRLRDPYQIAIVVPLLAAALPLWQVWLRDQVVRRFAVALAVSVHVLVAIQALPTFWQVHREFEERLALLSQAPARSAITVPPYSRFIADYFVQGEDLTSFGLREQVAVEVFHLRKLDIASRSRAVEPSTQLDIAARWEITPAMDLHKFVPDFLASDLGIARRQVGTAMRALVAEGRTVKHVEVVVTNLDFAERRGRDVVAAWGEGKTLRFPSLRARVPDSGRRVTFSINSSGLGEQYDEVWVIAGKEAQRATQAADGARAFSIFALEPHFVVLCSPRSCVLAGIVRVAR
jgi:hypothetical protein